MKANFKIVNNKDVKKSQQLSKALGLFGQPIRPRLYPTQTTVTVIFYSLQTVLRMFLICPGVAYFSRVRKKRYRAAQNISNPNRSGVPLLIRSLFPVKLSGEPVSVRFRQRAVCDIMRS
jgi:hypothetical protein